jgi:hypothetical protein
MAGTPDDSNYPGNSTGLLNPALGQFVGNLQTPEAQDWAGDAASKIQNYLTQKSLASEAAQAGDDMVNNLDQTKSGLVSLVQSDPGATSLAISLAQTTVNGLIAQHGHLDPGDRAEASDQLVSHMQTEIAHASVQRLAEMDKPAALAQLDKLSDYLPDDHQDALRQYADTQEIMRGQDAQAMALQQQKDAALRGYANASSYLKGITDDAGSFRATPGFLAGLMADQSVALPTKLALHAGYNMLHQYGDPDKSDPHVAADLLTRIGSDTPPQQGEIFSHLGSGLTVSDAGFLNDLIAPASPQRRSDLRLLSDTVSQARNTLASPSNGPAGTVAFGRFTNWLMPALQRGANLTEMMSDNVLQQFAPTPRDAVDAVTPRGPRLPLASIFAGPHV